MDHVNVIETTLGTGPFPKPGLMFAVIERFLRALIPAANPDFEHSYERVFKWWIEIDAEGVAQRELGFDEAGEVIVAGPLGKNFGFFTDSNATFAPAEYAAVEPASFEAAWSAFERRWAQQQHAQV